VFVTALKSIILLCNFLLTKNSYSSLSVFVSAIKKISVLPFLLQTFLFVLFPVLLATLFYNFIKSLPSTYVLLTIHVAASVFSFQVPNFCLPVFFFLSTVLVSSFLARVVPFTLPSSSLFYNFPGPRSFSKRSFLCPISIPDSLLISETSFSLFSLLPSLLWLCFLFLSVFPFLFCFYYRIP
jgi:hypothetical protein